MRSVRVVGVLTIVLVLSACGASSSERLAEELCDIQILYGPEPASPAGRDLWEDFAEKGSELGAMDGAGDYRIIGIAARQLASETRAEVRGGGGNARSANPNNVWWHQAAGQNWDNAANTWASMCLELVL